MEYGHILEAHCGAGDLADFGLKVKVKALAAQLPGRQPAGLVVALTGGVSALPGKHALFAGKINPLRRTVTAGHEAVTGRGKSALETVQLEV